MLQSHKTYNMKTHIRPLRDTQYACHTPAWVQKWIIMWDTIKWICNFLKQRSQWAVLNGKHSLWTHVDSIVLQGSVLAPLLFLLHINDLTKSVSSHVRLFADNCLVYTAIKSVQDQINLSWYVVKANVDHTLSGQGTADSTLDHWATIPRAQ